MRILLVEDNSDHRDLMRRALTGQDSTWEVEEAASGEEALRHLAEGEAYDVAFLDYSLPERDGLEVLEEIQRGEAPPPVVMVTGRGDEQVAVKAMKGGAYDYVVKGKGYLQRLPVVAQRAVEAHQLAVERKQTWEELRASEDRFKTIFNQAPLGVALIDSMTGHIRMANPMFVKIVGRTMEETTHTDWMSITHPDDVREILDDIKLLNVGKIAAFQTRIRFLHPDDTVVWLSMTFAPMTVEDKLYPLNLCMIEDITERKQTEEELRASEENYRRSLDESPLGVAIVSEEGDILYTNRAILDILGHESIEELRKTPFTNCYTESSYAEFRDRKEKRHLHADYDSEYEIDFVRKDGEVRHLQVWRKRVLWNFEDHYQVIYHDTTNQKRAEEALHSSFREKELLLREVHHRVKNNMQVISGLLDLQASLSGIPELKAMFRESQNRIRSMALVHEKLYASTDFAIIDLAGYVRALSQELFQSYSINPGKIDLIIQTAGTVCVDINKAIPCGLILNELISNAIKHAFPGDGPYELRIIIHETKNTEIEIVVRDNGLGLPDDVEIHQPGTVGLYLVNGLVKNQLDGQIEVRRDAGTEFRIKFPL